LPVGAGAPELATREPGVRTFSDGGEVGCRSLDDLIGHVGFLTCCRKCWKVNRPGFAGGHLV
jgi:hypothetical protein